MNFKDTPALAPTQIELPLPATPPGAPFKETAADGFILGGFTWRHTSPDPAAPS
jgi:hypothetical protein